jgi:hypothetical protein
MSAKKSALKGVKQHRDMWLALQPGSDVGLGYLVMERTPLAFVPMADGAARLAHRIGRNAELGAKSPAVDLRNSGIQVGQKAIPNELWSSTMWRVDGNGKLKRDTLGQYTAGCFTVALQDNRPFLAFCLTCVPMVPPKLKGQSLGVRPRSRR